MNEEAVESPEQELGKVAQFLEEKKVKFTPVGKTNSGVEILMLEASDLTQACKELKKGMKLNRLNYLVATEVKDGYQSSAFVDNIETNDSVLLKVVVAKDAPNIPSLSSIFPTADWQEREAFDMMGINYEGHPNLTRILNPDKWEGHPLRKDYIGPIDELNQPINY